MTEHDGGNTAGTQHEDEQQQRIHSDERMSMDGGDMEDAIDHEQDQKFDADDASRYEGDVDEAISGDRA